MIEVPVRIKNVFFDVDGVLSAPCYYDDEINEYVIGFSDERWEQYLNNEGIYTYKYCKPVYEIKDFLLELKQKNIRSYVLSTVANKVEARAKTLFLDNNYHDLFDDYFYVEHDREKVLFVEDFIRKNELYKDECLMVDDTYSILLDFRVKGISAAHISNIMANNITR